MHLQQLVNFLKPKYLSHQILKDAPLLRDLLTIITSRKNWQSAAILKSNKFEAVEGLCLNYILLAVSCHIMHNHISINYNGVTNER